jgi:hypothetical protein
MHRNYKAGLHSNSRIKYNKFTNEKTNNRYIVTQLFDNQFKVTMDKLYKSTENLSNANMKEMNHRDHYYKITDEDYDSQDDYDDTYDDY